jgi:hypothetical protein
MFLSLVCPSSSPLARYCADHPLDFHENFVRGWLPDRQLIADLKPGTEFVNRLAATSIARAHNDWLNDEVCVFFALCLMCL